MGIKVLAPTLMVAQGLTARFGLGRRRPPLVPPKLTHVRKGGGEVELDFATLESRRIVGHDVSDPRSKAFDMLRTQVLQSMDAKKWQLLAITSPTPGCGKTLTAINLALSIARQPERAVLLVDMDLRKPQVARRLGLPTNTGLLDVLDGQTALRDALVRARAGRYMLSVLPTETATMDSSEWITSASMGSFIDEIRTDFLAHTIILDLPPMLAGDDVIALLPRVDCVMLVTAVGISSVAEVEECNKYLRSANLVRMVVNKVPASNSGYYY